MAGPSSPSPATVARLSHLNYLEYGRELARWSGAAGALEERDGVSFCASATDFPVLVNGAARLDPSVAPEVVVDLADEWFGRRASGYSLVVRSDAEDDDLFDHATDRGLISILDSPQMVCRAPIDGPPPEGVLLRWIADVDDVVAMTELQDAAYQSLGMPPGVIRKVVADCNRVLEPHLATVLALVDGKPVAGAQLHLSHGIGGVYFVGVLEEARGRGLAELVTRMVTNEGFARGAAFVGLQASPMGESLYRRMGYEEIYRYRSVTRFAPAPAQG